MSWMVTASSTATVAENKPVYGVPIYDYMHLNIDTVTSTHKNEQAFSVLLPAFGHLIIISLCNLRIEGKEWSRAVTEAGFPLWLRKVS